MTKRKHILIGLVVVVLIGIGGFFTAKALVTDSVFDDDVLALGLQSDGQSIIGGRFTKKLVRVDLDGDVDETFSKTWTVAGFNDDILTLAVGHEDEIVIGGEFTNFNMSLVGYIARVHKDGSLDTEFARKIGTGFDDVVRFVSIKSDGKILCVGSFLSFNGTRVNHIARLNPDGTLDNSFKPEGGFDAPASSVLGLKSGKAAAGGEFKSYQSVSQPYFAIIE